MEIPKGVLIPVGGNENKGSEQYEPGHPSANSFLENGILMGILEEVNGLETKMEVVTTASRIPEEIGQNYLEAFSRLKCTSINVIHIKSREDAEKEQYLKRLQEAEVVLFTGGDQMRLSAIFGGTKFHELLLKRYMEENFVIAGTSAGAMAMCSTMIARGKTSEALYKDEVKLSTGFGLIHSVIIDTHFIARGRFGRLAQSVAANPGCIGLGLGEDTGVIIREGHKLRAIGSGLTVVIDGHHITHSNIAERGDHTPLSIENLVVHVMAPGNCYDLKKRKFYRSAKEAEKQLAKNI